MGVIKDMLSPPPYVKTWGGYITPIPPGFTPLHVGTFLVRFSTYGGPFSLCEGLSAPLLFMWGLFATFFYLCGGPFHHVRALLLPFSPCGEGAFFVLMGGGLEWAGAHAHYILHNTVMLK